MEDLSQDQKDVYNTYITNGIDKNDAEGLVRGTLSQEAFFSKLDAKEKPKDVNSLLDQEGYDTKLIEKVGKKVKERKESSEYLAESGPDDRMTFDALGFTKEEAFNFSGVRTDTDKELPGRDNKFAILPENLKELKTFILTKWNEIIKDEPLIYEKYKEDAIIHEQKKMIN